MVGRESTVGIATYYGLDGQGTESRFSVPVHTGPGAHQPPIQRVPGLFPRGEVAGPYVDHPPPSSAKIKERVKL
jgi:hypothetical protein